ncbi:Zc3h12a-like Ribonuclease NYN domain [Popillia japonica]|uniref:Zc3h12a-like Ribonuclease NYN domain n=1 Tax=Popillia japonica TaxID=7064 RepID=A0AAW1LRT4_POPJA
MAKKSKPASPRVHKNFAQQPAGVKKKPPSKSTTKVVTLDLCGPKKRRGRGRRRSKRKSFIKKLVNRREITCVEGPEGALNIQITSSLSSNTSTETNKQNDFITQNNKSPNRKIENVEKERTLNELYKTIDCVEEDGNSDVILVPDCDDSEVIYVGEETVSQKNKPRSDIEDESVILIDDDSVVEVPPMITRTIANRNCNQQISHTTNLIRSNNVQNCGNMNTNMASPIGNVKELNGRNTRVFTSTPIRQEAEPYHALSTLMENLAGMQVDHSKRQEPIPTRAIIKTSILNDQIKQIRRSVSANINGFGSNFLNAGPVRLIGLRPIFIDGSNVAISHSNGKFFSVEGLKICIDYFKMRGHEVTGIVPQFRKKVTQSSNWKLLQQLEKEGTVIFTPSRTVNGRHIVPYDDRYIVLLAHVYKGVIVSSDNYSDLLRENPNLLETIENRVLNPTWLKNMIIFGKTLIY